MPKNLIEGASDGEPTPRLRSSVEIMRGIYEELNGGHNILIEFLNPGEQPTCAKEELKRWSEQLNLPASQGAPLSDPVLGIENNTGPVIHFDPPIDGSRLAEWFPQLNGLRRIRYIHYDHSALEIHGPSGGALEGNLGSIDGRLTTVTGANQIRLSDDEPTYSVAALYGALSGLESIDSRFKGLRGVTGISFPFSLPTDIHLHPNSFVDLALLLPSSFSHLKAHSVPSHLSYICLLPDGGVHVVGRMIVTEDGQRLPGDLLEDLKKGGFFYFTSDGAIKKDTDWGEGGY